MGAESEPQHVLVLGSASAGKTTFLVQLYGRVSAGTGNLRARTVPTSLGAIEEGFRRLQQGLAVAHTPHGTDTSLSLPAVGLDGRSVYITVPDYAGEDLRSLVHNRRVPDRWRSGAASSDHWLLMIRLTQYPELPNLLTRPIGELAQASVESEGDDIHELPIDMWTVELLQALVHTRRTGADASLSLPRLTLVMSCWDELGVSPGTRPADVAQERLALLYSYCCSTWGDRFDVAGLSAQGQALDESAPATNYLDAGPQQMGWVITAAGEQSPDLTLLVHS